MGRWLPQARCLQHRQQHICLGRRRGADGRPATPTPPGCGLAARAGDGARASSNNESVADKSSKASIAAGKYSAAWISFAAPAGSAPRSRSDGPRHQLHRIHQVGVPGDLPVVITIQPNDLGEDVSIAGIALGAGGGVPLPVPRRGQRVDREHLVAGRVAAPSPTGRGRSRSRRTPGPRPPHSGRSAQSAGACLGDHRVEPRDAFQTLRQAGPREPPPGFVLDLDVVVIFGPIVPDEQATPAVTPSIFAGQTCRFTPEREPHYFHDAGEPVVRRLFGQNDYRASRSFRTGRGRSGDRFSSTQSRLILRTL